MKYSVLMSVYKNDNPDFLKIALKSIYDDQTRKPDEIIVVFDGPVSDELRAVLDDFRKGKEEFVKYYPQDVNRGLGEALKIGTEYCSGDYIFRMDADDVSTPDRFEIQSKYVEEHPEIDVLGSDIVEFNETPDEPNLKKRVCFANHNDIVKMGKKRSPMNHVSVCIKKEALIAVGGYSPLLYVEDYYLWERMISAGYKLANINKTLVYTRVGNGFTKRRSNKEYVKSWKILQEYMLASGMITKREVRKNMFCIKVFVKMPAWIKKILYSKLLRK